MKNITCQYTFRMLAPQYIRGGIGFVSMAGPLLFAETTDTVAAILAIGAVAFTFDVLHTILRHACTIECDAQGIAVSGAVTREIDWTELRDVRVRYFSTRRDGQNGWMQLVLKGPRASIRIESTLPGFKDIVAVAVKAADRKELSLSPTTLGNIEVLRLDNRIFMSGNGSPCRIS